MLERTVEDAVDLVEGEGGGVAAVIGKGGTGRAAVEFIRRQRQGGPAEKQGNRKAAAAGGGAQQTVLAGGKTDGYGHGENLLLLCSVAHIGGACREGKVCESSPMRN